MQVGQRGFLVTCNFREKECIKESYNLLNSYNVQSDDDVEQCQPAPGVDVGSSDEGEEQEDISELLANEIKASKAQSKKGLFQAVDTQTTNCIFIDARVKDPLDLGVRIVRDVAKSQVAKTRFLLRLLPVEIVSKANLADMLSAAEKLFDKHFLNEPKSYSIMFNRRYNNDIKRDEVIKEFAEIIQAKNIRNKVDLKNPQVSVIVEVIKGFCCLSVLPDYLALKKYNLVELAATKNPDPPAPTQNLDQEDNQNEAK